MEMCLVNDVLVCITVLGRPSAKRRYMGITMLTLTPQLIHELQARNHELPGDVAYGVLVWKVVVGSPAYV